MGEETGAPCWKCGVNAWTSCKHREAYREPPKPDKETRQRISGGGSYRIFSPEKGRKARNTYRRSTDG